jgi:hypothetical protein
MPNRSFNRRWQKGLPEAIAEKEWKSYLINNMDCEQVRINRKWQKKNDTVVSFSMRCHPALTVDVRPIA